MNWQSLFQGMTFEGICYDTLENCVQRLQLTAARESAVEVSIAPVNQDSHFFAVGKRDYRVIKGEGYLTRLPDRQTTKISFEIPSRLIRNVGIILILLLVMAIVFVSGRFGLVAIFGAIVIIAEIGIELYNANQIRDFVKRTFGLR